MPLSNNVRKVTSENYPTDSGREGELIFRLVYEQAGCKKPVSRLWLSSMEETAIREGFAHLKPSTEYDALYNAALCRERADWMVGINASRLFSCLYNQPLAVGRVMTPVLAMTVVREAAIAAFVPEKFYTVALTLADGGTASSLVVVPSFGLVPPRGVGTVAAVGQRRGDTEWEPAAEVVFRGQARSQSCKIGRAHV